MEKDTNQIKDYTTNIKPINISYTNLQRDNIAEKLLKEESRLIVDDGSTMIDLNDLSYITTDYADVLETATDISNKKYRLDNPYITDLCANIYTQLTTIPISQLNNIFINLIYNKSTNGVIFWLSRESIIKLALGKLVNDKATAMVGAASIKKNIMSILTPVLKGDAVIPKQIISIKTDDVDVVIRTVPIRFGDAIYDKKTGETLIKVELNGLLYPIKRDEDKYLANTSYQHSVANLTSVLALGEDLYKNTPEYQTTKLKPRAEVARKFIDLIQISYNQKYHLPCTSSKSVNGVIYLEVWGETLECLYPSAFRGKKSGKIRKSEFVTVANLSSKYFHLALEKLQSMSSVEENEYLVIPSPTDFCRFLLNKDKVIFTSYSKSYKK